MIVPPLSTRDIAIHQQAFSGVKVNMARLSAVGGSSWTVIEKKDNGITAATESTLGTITGYALAPTDANVVAGPGSVVVQRDHWIMVVPLPAAIALQQSPQPVLHVQSVADGRRFLVTAIDDTNNSGYLDLTLEPA